MDGDATHDGGGDAGAGQGDDMAVYGAQDADWDAYAGQDDGPGFYDGGYDVELGGDEAGPSEVPLFDGRSAGSGPLSGPLGGDRRPAPPGVTAWSHSQLDVPGAGSACAFISVFGIAALFRTYGRLRANDVGAAVHAGGQLHSGMMRVKNREVHATANEGLDLHPDDVGFDPEDLVTLNRDQYFHAEETPLDVLDHSGLEKGATHTVQNGDLDGLVGVLRVDFERRERTAASVVIGAYTIAIARVGDRLFLFDSHGDALVPTAFVQEYRLDDADGLIARLCGKLEDRLPSAETPSPSDERDPRRDIGVTFFTPRND
jgi:hypothetical protein